jgi:putative restriction endonuclease
MTQDVYRSHIAGLEVHSGDGRRAPGKALLVLLAVRGMVHGTPRLRTHNSLTAEAQPILEVFGPPPAGTQPALPFGLLADSGLWDMETSATDPESEPAARGGFPQSVHDLLVNNRYLMKETVLHLLDLHFTKSVQPDLLEMLGVSELWDPASRSAQASPQQRAVVAGFRETVLTAYRNRCAVCGTGVWVGGIPLGIQLTHIHWHSHGGEFSLANALALCTLHQKLFDVGGFTISDDLRLEISSRLHIEAPGGSGWIMPIPGSRLHTPEHPDDRPHPDNLAWHRREVYRE